jgi:diguanylate cyclase (GGDEF)-like protein/PAS domain S-box-containing protein
MNTRVRVLIVEDVEDDAKLALRALRRGGFDPTYRRVQTAAELKTALAEESWDTVISDFRMQGFNGIDALDILRATGLDIPFILISGTIGEETAVAAMKAGASDYIMKQNLARLAPALERELKEAQNRGEARRVLRERELAVVELQKLSRAVEQSPVSVTITDRDGMIEYVNPYFCHVSGYSRDDLIGQNPRILQSGETPKETYGELWQALLAGKEWRGELLNRKKSGELYWERQAISPIADPAGVISHFIAVKEDITERKRSEQELRRLNRTLTLVRECNKVLVYATDESALLEGVCHRIAESKAYVAVWAGFAEFDAARRVRPVAWSGIEDAVLLASINDITWADSEGGQGPTGTAVRTGQTVVMRERNDPRLLRWRDIAVRLGVNSTISLPLKAAGRVLGAISIYARQADAFDEHEVGLLSELADDLAYGLVALRAAAERQRIEQELSLRQHAVDSSSNGIMITAVAQPDKPLIYVNPAFERITGYTAQEVIGRNPRFLVGEDWEQIGLEEIRASLRGRRVARTVLRNYRKDGTLFWNELSLAPVSDESGEATHFISIINDVTERVNYETQLEHQANYDALTGLANRNLLADRMAQTITYAHRAHRLVAVILLDLDRFKVVNDSLGHATGDELLKVVAERLNVCVRPGDTVARLGGDEFVVVMADVAHEDDVAPLVRNLLGLLAHDITVAGHDVVATASVGVALYPRDGEEAESLLKNADVAMYRAKDLGRNSFQFYTPEMNVRTLQRLELETALRHALERNELVLFYQPKVELQRGQMVGAEALIRWRHPRLGMVSPADFIPLAEETGLIVPIGKWVIETACNQIKAWQNEGLPDISVAVNLSACQFEQEDLPRVVAQALHLSKVQAHCLELELTESAVMQNPERTVATLRELKSIGVRLSLDDFGTGYSSLNYLKRFPIDTLKIDQSFVRDITIDADGAAIAVAVVSLAHSLRLSVVAEGVETEAQLNYLRRHSCDEMQGYYFSRPLPADEFAALLRERRSLSLGTLAATD